MGYIKEPEGVDFVVGPHELSAKDIKEFRKAFAAHKAAKRVSVKAIVRGEAKVLILSDKVRPSKFHQDSYAKTAIVERLINSKVGVPFNVIRKDDAKLSTKQSALKPHQNLDKKKTGRK